MNDNNSYVEEHPWPPFVPDGAKVLILGTFPPKPMRWSMEFYYPNRTNDFWYMMGLIFCGDKYALYNKDSKTFDLDAIRDLLTREGIALHDTGRKVRRLRDNASDKYLEIVEAVPLYGLLATMPHCHTVVTTGEKAASVVAGITGTEVPKMGECVLTADRKLVVWRMPSTSRAYPLALEKKAEYYRKLFNSLDV